MELAKVVAARAEGLVAAMTLEAAATVLVGTALEEMVGVSMVAAGTLVACVVRSRAVARASLPSILVPIVKAVALVG